MLFVDSGFIIEEKHALLVRTLFQLLMKFSYG